MIEVKAASTTHPHIAAAIRSELLTRPVADATLLDVGCGNGQLLAYLALTLPAVRELHGYDVADSGHVVGGFPETTIATLQGAAPAHNWAVRIQAGVVGKPWPYPDDFFDVVCSNQVVEHVFDLDTFFRELQRTLKPGGVSVHVFPFRRVVWEAHTAMPLAHRFRDNDTRAAVIRLWSRLGLGRFAQYRKRMDFDEYVDLSTDLIQFACCHRSWPEIAATARAAGLRASRRFTSEYYRQKVRAVRGQPPVETYERRPPFVEAIAAELLTTIASGTVVLEKPTTYQPWDEQAIG